MELADVVMSFPALAAIEYLRCSCCFNILCDKKSLGAIEDLPRVKEKEISSLRKFFDDLQAHIQILEAQGPHVARHLYDPKRLKVVLSKLPTDVVVAWTSYKENRNLNTDIRLLCEWLRRRVRILEKADFTQLGETRPKHSMHTTLNNSSKRDKPDSKQFGYV